MHIQLTAKDLAAIKEAVLVCRMRIAEFIDREERRGKGDGNEQPRHFVVWSNTRSMFWPHRTSDGKEPDSCWVTFYEVKRDGKAILQQSRVEIPGNKQDIHTWTARELNGDDPTKLSEKEATRLRALAKASSLPMSTDSDPRLIRIGLAQCRTANRVEPTARGYTWCAENLA